MSPHESHVIAGHPSAKESDIRFSYGSFNNGNFLHVTENETVALTDVAITWCCERALTFNLFAQTKSAGHYNVMSLQM